MSQLKAVLRWERDSERDSICEIRTFLRIDAVTGRLYDDEY